MNTATFNDGRVIAYPVVIKPPPTAAGLAMEQTGCLRLAGDIAKGDPSILPAGVNADNMHYPILRLQSRGSRAGCIPIRRRAFLLRMDRRRLHELWVDSA